MTSFAVDLELLTELTEQMAAFGQRFESVRDDVDARVRRLHAVWNGAAAAEQTHAHQRWRAGAAEMHEALGELRAISTTAHGNYSSALRANLQMWSR